MSYARNQELVNLILQRYPLPEWAAFTELRNAAGAKFTGAIDVAAFNVWPSGGGQRVACEIKVSRSDFMRELKQPGKRKWVEETFQETYFVTPLGLVAPKEIPEKWGLLVPTKKGDRLRRVVIPTYRGLKDPSYLTVLTLLRRMCEDLNKEKNKVFKLEGDEITVEALNAVVREKVLKSQESIKVFQDQARKQTDKYYKLEEQLTEPLAVLRKLARDSGYWNSVRESDVITGDMVREWFIKAGQETILEHNREILDAHQSINNLVKKLGIADDNS